MARYGPVAGSLALNVLLVALGVSVLIHPADAPPEPIGLELVTAPAPPRIAEPITPPLAAPQPRLAAPPKLAAPPYALAPSTAPPLTLPGKPAGDAGVETIPAVPGPVSPAVPRGLERYLQTDPCADATTRRLHPECESKWAQHRDAVPDRQAREERAERVKQAELDLGLHNDCGSVHMGCAPPEAKTVIGANPVGPEMGSGVVKQYGNSYHRDPAFGD